MKPLLSIVVAGAAACAMNSGSAMARDHDPAPVVVRSADIAPLPTVFGPGGVGLFQKTQWAWGGRRYCWYEYGWHGPGYYWCGYSGRRGYGWGGGVGWHGWSRGPVYRGGGYHGGGYRGDGYHGDGYHGGAYHGGGGYHGGGHGGGHEGHEGGGHHH